MKKSATVLVEDSVLDRAVQVGLDLSSVLEQAIVRRLAMFDYPPESEAARLWAEENREAIEQRNEFIKANGTLTERIRGLR